MLQTLDSLAPYLIFAYGCWTTAAFLLFGEHLEKARISDTYRRQFMQNRWLGVVSIVVGGLWILQNFFVGAL